MAQEERILFAWKWKGKEGYKLQLKNLMSDLLLIITAVNKYILSNIVL